MKKKYELLENETKEVKGHTLYRIRALCDFKCRSNVIHKGKIGGWVESEENLSQTGNCWIDENSMVYEDSRVEDNAYVYNRSEVYGKSHIKDDALVCQSTICGDSTIFKNATVGYTKVVDCILGRGAGYTREGTLESRIICARQDIIPKIAKDVDDIVGWINSLPDPDRKEFFARIFDKL